MKKFACFFILGLLFSCESNLNKSTKSNDTLAVRPSTPINNGRKMDSLINLAVLEGNEKAYNEAASYYLIEDMGENFLYVALTVANKYDNPEACYHVFTILNSTRTKEKVENLDNRTKNLALYYLLKSYEKGFNEAKFRVEEVFGKNKEVPKASFYLEQFAK